MRSAMRLGSLGTKHGGLDPLLFNQVGDQIAQNGPAMRRLFSKFEA